MMTYDELNDKISDLQSGLKLENDTCTYDLNLDEYNVLSKSKDAYIESLISEIETLKVNLIKKIIDNKSIDFKLEYLNSGNQTISNRNNVISDLERKQNENNLYLIGISKHLYLYLNELNKFKDKMKDE